MAMGAPLGIEEPLGSHFGSTAISSRRPAAVSFAA
jgi:hypothetical protein